MATKLVVLAYFISASVPAVWAVDPVEVVAVAARASPDSRIEPKISPRILPRCREKITVSFRIAVDRLSEVPECRSMFTELGTEALATLGGMSFYPIGWQELRPNVCNGSAVYTLVGGGPVWVCRRFSRMSDSHAAMIIIHEALHHAGLTEQPHDPNGMTSGAISDRVLKRCGPRALRRAKMHDNGMFGPS